MSKKEHNKKGRNIGDFLINGFKKTMSSGVGETNTIKYIKQRSFDVYSGVYDVFSIIFTSFAIIFYYLLGMFKIAKNIPHAFQMAAKNNFRLGIDSLKKNDPINARIRFFLSNMFYSKSSMTKYYIAYTYYMQHNLLKSLKYLQKSITLNSKNKRSLELLQEIEAELKS